jgi:endothelin-converting enzyme/putative endopeptidase
MKTFSYVCSTISICVALFIPNVISAQGTSLSVIDATAMNRSVDPCIDFYKYACGNWVAHHPVPADVPGVALSSAVVDLYEKQLLEILNSAALPTSNRSLPEQWAGDYFASCLDTAAMNARGIAAIKPELDRINRIGNPRELAREIARLHRIAVPVLFEIGAIPDAKDRRRTIAAIYESGFSLPNRNYYLHTDPASTSTREGYEKHIGRMLQLLGHSTDAASKEARSILDFETVLAKGAMDVAFWRDPAKTYNIFSKDGLRALMPDFAWDEYFDAIGAPPFETADVLDPDFMKRLSAALADQSADTIKAYLAYRLLREYAEQLPQSFAGEAFDFWQRHLRGVREPRPHTEECVGMVTRHLGEPLAQLYIQTAFPEGAKAVIDEMVQGLESAFAADVRALPWLSEETKGRATDKLSAVAANVGRPAKWSGIAGKISIRRDDLLGNTVRAREAAFAYEIGKIERPTDRMEWTANLATLVAFYSNVNNSINVSAGKLQPPLFDPKRDIAMNYGAIGMIMGHELTHGFDDQGRKFDQDGNMVDWWTPADAAGFEKRAACLVGEYSAFTAVDDIKVNGTRTSGEDIAHAGGLRVAYLAMEEALHGQKHETGGYTPEQRFFLSFAQLWCGNIAPQEARRRALTDPHPPGPAAVNVTLRNMPEFRDAFACKADQPMVNPEPCRIW